jgi:hypothetical protein
MRVLRAPCSEGEPEVIAGLSKWLNRMSVEQRERLGVEGLAAI